MFTYNPVLPDELELTVGDLVEVLQTYDDGWGVGRHINPKSNKTILEGAVPMVCLQRKHAWNVSDQQRPSIDRLRQSGDSYTLPSPPMPPPNQNASFYTAPERRTSLIMTNQVKTGVVRSGTVRMQTIDPQRHNANSYSTKQDFS
jgi:nicotinic acid phosphoribosyltransferase